MEVERLLWPPAGRLARGSRSVAPRRRGDGTFRFVVATGVGATAVLAVAATRLSPARTIPVLLALAGVGAGLLARKSVVRRVPRQPASPIGERDARAWRDRAFKGPRVFFYLGVLTITQLTWRVPLGGFTVSDVFFFIAVALAALVSLSTRYKVMAAVPDTGLWAGIFIFAIGALLSSFSAAHSASSFATLARFVYVTGLWFVLASIVLSRGEHVERAIVLWVTSAAITGAAAIGQYLFGDVIPSTTRFYGRMTGFTQHVNDLGGVTSIALAPAVVLATSGSRRAGRRLYAGFCTALIGAGLILSGSVGGMLAAAVAIGMLLISSRSVGRVLAVVAILVALGSASFALSSGDIATPAKRFAAATGSEGTDRDTLRARLRTFDEAWDRVTTKPLVGTGMGPSNGTLSSGYRVHNMVLGPWVEAGILGAVGMIVILSSVAGLVRAAARRSFRISEWRLAIGLAAAFVALVSFGMGAPVLLQRYGWIPAALIVAFRGVQRAANPSARSPLGSGVKRPVTV